MITKILVPTDGSKPAKKSVEYAVELARQTGASIILVSIVDKSPFIPQVVPVAPSSTRIMEPIEDLLQRAAEAYIADAEKICKKNQIPAKSVIRSGHPVDQIIKEAVKTKTDLIVLGSQGKSALKAAVLGSVAFGIISKETKIPVLVVRK